MSKYFLILVGWLGVSVMAEENSQDIADKVVERHRAMAERVEQLGGYIRDTITEKSVSKVHSLRLVDYKDDCVLFHFEHLKESKFGVSTVDALSSRYCFSLSKRNTDPWAIKKYEISDDPNASMRQLGFDRDYQRPSKVPDMVSFTPKISGIADGWVLLRNFKSSIISSEQTPAGVQVKLKRQLKSAYTQDGADLSDQWTECKITFQPDGFMLPIHLEEIIDSPEHRRMVKTDIEYELNSKGIPTSIVEKSVEEDLKTGGKFETLSTTKLALGRVPQSRFLLTEYGFQEPSELQHKPTAVPGYWLAILAGSLAIAMAGVMKLRQRAAS